MKWVWKHRYSLLSISLSVADSLFVYGAAHHWFWAVTVVPRSDLYQRLALVHFSMGVSSIALGVMALPMESSSTLSKVAVIMASTVFFLLNLAFAV